MRKESNGISDHRHRQRPVARGVQSRGLDRLPCEGHVVRPLRTERKRQIGEEVARQIAGWHSSDYNAIYGLITLTDEEWGILALWRAKNNKNDAQHLFDFIDQVEDDIF